MHHLRAQLLRKEDLSLIQKHEKEYYHNTEAKKSEQLKNLNEIPSAFEVNLNNPPRYIYNKPARFTNVVKEKEDNN